MPVSSPVTLEGTQTYLNGNRNYAATTFSFTVGSAVILCANLFVSLEVLRLLAASLLLLLILCNQMIPIFNSIQQNYQFYLDAWPTFARVMEMWASFEAAAEPKIGSSRRIKPQQDLRFEQVGFGYKVEGEDPAIWDRNLIVDAGKTTADIGPSGAGKSTIADLVMVLLTPRSGQVLVDGLLLEGRALVPGEDRGSVQALCRAQGISGNDEMGNDRDVSPPEGRGPGEAFLTRSWVTSDLAQ